MAKNFTIEEQPPNGSSDQPAKFEWTLEGRSLPKGPWQYAVKLRTNRTDYPGSDKPTEQVLGSHFEPFTLEGEWEDAYNGADWADETRKAFESMVRRGNPVRIEFDSLLVYGLITDFQPSYYRKARIGYRFTVSPHYRNESGDVRTNPPRKTTTPNDYSAELERIAAEMRAANIAALVNYFVANIGAQVETSIAAQEALADQVAQIVASQVLPLTEDPVLGSSSIARLASTATTAKTEALGLLTLLSAYGSSSTSTTPLLTFEKPEAAISGEVWLRDLRQLAREMILAADSAAKSFEAMIRPDALTYYRPMAGESLYAISNRFYGNPERWRDIFDRNNLASTLLSGTEILIIPIAGSV